MKMSEMDPIEWKFPTYKGRKAAKMGAFLQKILVLHLEATTKTKINP